MMLCGALLMGCGGTIVIGNGDGSSAAPDTSIPQDASLSGDGMIAGDQSASQVDQSPSADDLSSSALADLSSAADLSSSALADLSSAADLSSPALADLSPSAADLSSSALADLSRLADLQSPDLKTLPGDLTVRPLGCRLAYHQLVGIASTKLMLLADTGCNCDGNQIDPPGFVIEDPGNRRLLLADTWSLAELPIDGNGQLLGNVGDSFLLAAFTDPPCGGAWSLAATTVTERVRRSTTSASRSAPAAATPTRS